MNNKNNEKTPLPDKAAAAAAEATPQSTIKRFLGLAKSPFGGAIIVLILLAATIFLSLTIWKKSSDDKDKSDNDVQENRRRRRRAQDIEDAKNELGAQDINLLREKQLKETGKKGAEMTENQAKVTDKSNKSLAGNLIDPARKIQKFEEGARSAVKDAKVKVYDGRRRADLKFNAFKKGVEMSGNAVRRKVAKAQRTIGKFVPG